MPPSAIDRPTMGGANTPPDTVPSDTRFRTSRPSPPNRRHPVAGAQPRRAGVRRRHWAQHDGLTRGRRRRPRASRRTRPPQRARHSRPPRGRRRRRRAGRCSKELSRSATTTPLSPAEGAPIVCRVRDDMLDTHPSDPPTTGQTVASPPGRTQPTTKIPHTGPATPGRPRHPTSARSRYPAIKKAA